MATSEAKVAGKTPKNKTSAKLLPEALAVDLHVSEDDYMIQSLGEGQICRTVHSWVARLATRGEHPT
jgi:hypothetical protein